MPLSDRTLEFTSESQLIETALLLLELKTKPSEIVAAVEVDSGFGIADLVIGEPAAKWLAYTRLSKVPSRWIYPLVDLPYRRNFSSTYFAGRAHVSIGTARKILSLYVDTGFCQTRPNNMWVKWYTPRPPFKRVVAVEAKLKDWRKALYQATRYQLFAHAAWVLLDENYSRTAIANINQFSMRNIGLATLNPQGILKAAHMPTDDAPHSLMSYWRASGELLRRIKAL